MRRGPATPQYQSRGGTGNRRDSRQTVRRLAREGRSARDLLIGAPNPMPQQPPKRGSAAQAEQRPKQPL